MPSRGFRSSVWEVAKKSKDYALGLHKQERAPRSGRQQLCRSIEADVARALTSSFNDGTPQGAQTANEFAQLLALVSGIITSRHREIARRLQRLYRSHDPSLPQPPGASAAGLSQSTGSRSAAQFSAQLHEVSKPATSSIARIVQPHATPRQPSRAAPRHALSHANTPSRQVLSSAGFQLSGLAEEEASQHGHFGDEFVWNVPVQMDWSQLDGSLVDHSLGGFDAYRSEERTRGQAISRPSWAHKVLLYHRGEVRRRYREGGVPYSRLLSASHRLPSSSQLPSHPPRAMRHAPRATRHAPRATRHAPPENAHHTMRLGCEAPSSAASSLRAR